MNERTQGITKNKKIRISGEGTGEIETHTLLRK